VVNSILTGWLLLFQISFSFVTGMLIPGVDSKLPAFSRYRILLHEKDQGGDFWAFKDR
jgi:hypothetical protein